MVAGAFGAYSTIKDASETQRLDRGLASQDPPGPPLQSLLATILLKRACLYRRAARLGCRISCC